MGLDEPAGGEPRITRGPAGPGFLSLAADASTADPLPTLQFEYRLGTRFLYAEAGGTPLFTDNEINMPRIYGPSALSK